MSNKLMKTWSPMPGLIYEICDATARDSILKIEERESNYFTSEDIDVTLRINGKLADAMAVGNALSQKLSLDGSLPMMGNLDMNTYSILNIKEPSIDNDITTKIYVDTLVNNTKENIENKYDEVYNNTKLRTYTNPTQFGCVADSSPEEILEALPNNSIFICLTEELTNVAWNFPEAVVDGYVLQIIKSGNLIGEENVVRMKMLLSSTSAQDGEYQGTVTLNIDEDSIFEWSKIPKMYSYVITLSASAWADNLQPVIANYVLKDNVKCQVITSAAFSTLSEYMNANVQCVAQEDNVLVFMCESIPSSDILVNVLVFV